MFTRGGRENGHLNVISRRAFVRVGAGLGGLSLAGLLRAEARGAVRPDRRRRSVIFVVLAGGISHIDTWDMKPDAPAEYRGEFSPIATALPGVSICEHFPRQAAAFSKFALLRGVRSVESDHFLSEVYTGLPRTAGSRPAFGSIVSRLHGPAGALPAYVSLNPPESGPFEFQKPHYVGAGHAPFRPSEGGVETLAPDAERARLGDRRALLDRLDAASRELDAGAADGLDRFRAQALDLITSPRAREAFDLAREPAATFERYGKGKYTHQADRSILYDWDARPFVLARRLIEAGVRVVTLSVGSWDHHSGANQQIFESYRHVLPVLDLSLTTLVEELEERGLRDEVLVVVLSEFGRTPKLSTPGPGREHWAPAGCVLLSGGGLRTGQVVGATDRRAEYPRQGHLDFQSLMATIYHVLGVDPRTILVDATGRPLPLLDHPEPIAELVGSA